MVFFVPRGTSDTRLAITPFSRHARRYLLPQDNKDRSTVAPAPQRLALLYAALPLWTQIQGCPTMFSNSSTQHLTRPLLKTSKSFSTANTLAELLPRTSQNQTRTSQMFTPLASAHDPRLSSSTATYVWSTRCHPATTDKEKYCHLTNVAHHNQTICHVGTVRVRRPDTTVLDKAFACTKSQNQLSHLLPTVMDLPLECAHSSDKALVSLSSHH